MGRGRRGGGGGMMRRPAAPARPAARSASTTTKPAAPPAQQSSVPATQQSSGGGGMLAGIGSTIAQGMAFGTGSAIAHRAVGAVAGSMSGGSEQPAAAAPEMAQGAMEQPSMNAGACATDKQMYYDCAKDNRDDPAVCAFLLEQLKACQQNQQMYG